MIYFDDEEQMKLSADIDYFTLSLLPSHLAHTDVQARGASVARPTVFVQILQPISQIRADTCVCMLRKLEWSLHFKVVKMKSKEE